MSRKWFVVALVAIGLAVALAAAGYMVPDLLPDNEVLDFTRALLSTLSGVCLASGVAVLLIEGDSLTRQSRRSKITRLTAKSIISYAAEAISWDALALGRWLGSVLPEYTSVDEEINKSQGSNWENSVNPVLIKVFQQAQQVTTKDINILDPIPEDEYKRTVFATRDFVSEVRKRLESNLDVHERLLELSESLEKLEQVLTRCSWPINIREEENRFYCLGQLGTTFIELHESLNRIYRRL